MSRLRMSAGRGKSCSLLAGLFFTAAIGLSACSGGGGDGTPATPTPTATPTSTAEPTFSTKNEASRFLNQATFGSTDETSDALLPQNVSEWFQRQISLPRTSHMSVVLGAIEDTAPTELEYVQAGWPTASFYMSAIEGEDQLRQRMTYALSQILVVSAPVDSELFYQPSVMAAYMDVLNEHALGNYRDLLQDVTYSPAMANFLTYLQNQKANPNTGQVPDENYARELMQLFTIGLTELNPDGSQVLVGGEPVETYSQEDIRGLAKVFTGLSYDTDSFYDHWYSLDRVSRYSPLRPFDEFHSTEEKRFLDLTIPPGTQADASISQALDHIFDHENVAPFVSRQLIQRLVTSHPSDAYVGRVSAVFEAGRYTLPNGDIVGDGRKGDLAAVACAILLDNEARNDAFSQQQDFGKVREPVIRFIHWARAFGADPAEIVNEYYLFDSSSPERLAQHPFRAPSVFNFYRPQYVAPNTSTGDAGLTAPELQIVNETSSIGYSNFMTSFIRGFAPNFGDDEENGLNLTYPAERALAGDPDALIFHLSDLLVAGALEASTANRIVDVLNEMPIRTEDEEQRVRDELLRVQIAILMVMTSPEYLVQR